MPTYTYECKKCGKVFDVFHSISATPLVKCEECGGGTKRMIGTGAGIIFKGSGFYETDYKKSASGGGESKGGDTKGAESKGAESKGSESKGSDSKSSESKSSESKSSESKGSASKGSESKGSGKPQKRSDSKK